MKNIVKYLFVIVLTLHISCDDKEDQIVPEFLDGTEYGVLLDVDVTSPIDVSVADINSYNLAFKVSFKGDKRPVESILINKVFVDNENQESPIVEEAVLTQFPSTTTLSATELVGGFPNLSLVDLEAGDSFNINFVIKYVDGLTVDKFDSGLRTNFKVSVTD